MNKYQTAFLNNIKKQWHTWQDNEDAVVSGEQIHRFLHSVCGTSGTIGLTGLSQIASHCMNRYQQLAFNEWPIEQLAALLSPILEYTGAEQAAAAVAATQPTMFEGTATILVVDDDEVFLTYLRNELESRGYSTLATTRPDMALRYVLEYQPECLITDLHMQNTSGFEVLLALKETLIHHYIPTTIISADNERSTRVQAYRFGADDFVSKPLDMVELAAIIERQLMRKRMFDQQLILDSLTGAMKLNRLNLLYLEGLKKVRQLGKPFAMAMLNIDKLNVINQKYGYSIGDAVLKQLGQVLLSKQELADCTLVRISGSSFIVLMPGFDLMQANANLNMALQTFEQHAFSSEAGVFHSRCKSSVLVVESDDLPLQHWLDQLRQEMNKRPDTAELPNLYIAIVDDDEIVQTMLTDYIKACFPAALQLSIRVFRDGEAFIQDSWSREGDRYLVILDRMMPRMDGIEVLQRIRGWEQSANYTVLMLTGLKGESDIVKALQYGADDYVTKPFSMRELEARIHMLSKRILQP